MEKITIYAVIRKNKDEEREYSNPYIDYFLTKQKAQEFDTFPETALISDGGFPSVTSIETFKGSDIHKIAKSNEAKKLFNQPISYENYQLPNTTY